MPGPILKIHLTLIPTLVGPLWGFLKEPENPRMEYSLKDLALQLLYRKIRWARTAGTS